MGATQQAAISPLSYGIPTVRTVPLCGHLVRRIAAHTLIIAELGGFDKRDRPAFSGGGEAAESGRLSACRMPPVLTARQGQTFHGGYEACGSARDRPKHKENQRQCQAGQS